MSQDINFTSNYQDESTDNGFQFEFKCDRCGSGTRSSFKSFLAGTASQVMGTVGNLFGGIFSQASELTNNVKSATWENAHDKAFVDATHELSDKFIQCPKCNAWVCRQKCWNDKKGLCKSCAPDLGVEMAAAQASKSVEEVWAHAAMAEEDKKLGTEVWREGIKASCPKCEAPLSANTKFCPNCGAEVKSSSQCAKCGAKLQPNSKFCPDCGQKC